MIDYDEGVRFDMNYPKSIFTNNTKEECLKCGYEMISLTGSDCHKICLNCGSHRDCSD